MKSMYELYKGIKCLGDLRVVHGIEGASRLCMLLGSPRDGDREVFAVMLCSDEVENATSLDYVVAPEHTGLSHPIMIETDLVGMVYRWQIDKRSGGLSTAVLDEIEIPYRGGSLEPSGTPCMSYKDHRWQWKLKELADLDKLTYLFWEIFWMKEDSSDVDDFD